MTWATTQTLRPPGRHRPGFFWKGKCSDADAELPAVTDVPGANIVTKAGSVPCLGRLKTQLKPLQAPGALGWQSEGWENNFIFLPPSAPVPTFSPKEDKSQWFSI